MSELPDGAPVHAAWAQQHDAEYRARVLDWAQRLMITKGYGWSKAMDTARDLAAPAKPAKPRKTKR